MHATFISALGTVYLLYVFLFQVHLTAQATVSPSVYDPSKVDSTPEIGCGKGAVSTPKRPIKFTIQGKPTSTRKNSTNTKTTKCDHKNVYYNYLNGYQY
ncbi:uncharacterized protein LOC120454660 [Drosophila santomea]|uniref:uncharacterized protein LOC120454660 n=1 Tax=Drosophila santomea TaxID=129105 RepID=UPI001953A92B|nr:uncharacterized protein LOC120454660 [Drosophila santomea]